MRPGLPDPIFGPNRVMMPFELPKLGTPLRAFVCATKTSKNVRGPLAIGQRVARPAGFVAGNEPVASLWGCDEWPMQVFEVVVDPADLFLGRGEMLLKTLAFRVVKEVPLEEVFGARAKELGVLFERVRSTPWLAPPKSLTPEMLGRLVSELYEVTSEYKSVRPLPVALMSDWSGACSTDQAVTATKGSPAGFVDAARKPLGEDDYQVSISTRVLRRILIRQSYVRMWEAGWEAAFGDYLRSSMKQNRPGDAKAAKRTWSKMRDKIEARREEARRAAIRTAYRMLDAAPDGQGDALFGKEDRSDVSEITAAGGSRVATEAWNFALSALTTAIAVLESPVVGLARSPSGPLFELYQMGLWPLGEVNAKVFAIYAPSRT